MIYKFYYINDGPHAKAKATFWAILTILSVLICILCGLITASSLLPEASELTILCIGGLLGWLYCSILIGLFNIVMKISTKKSDLTKHPLYNIDWENISVKDFENLITKIPDLNFRSFIIRRNKDGSTMYFLNAVPLDVVTRPELAEILIKNGAQINTQDANGNTPLHNASNIQIAKCLVKYGADYNIKNNKNQTAIETAREHNHLDVAIFLGNYKKSCDA